MSTDSNDVTTLQRAASMSFRIALFAAGLSLAIYIPFKYATQLHTISGTYAFLFPLSGLLVAAGMLLATRPALAFRFSIVVRSGVAALTMLWMATGLLCVPSLVESAVNSPAHGGLAIFHMVAQHVFLAGSLLAFAFAPGVILSKLGVRPTGVPERTQAITDPGGAA